MTLLIRTSFFALMFSLTLSACGGGASGEGGLLPSGGANTPSGNTSQANNSTEKFSATIEWDIPVTRENGDELLLSEIGGYEIIYRHIDENATYTEVVHNQNQDSLELTQLIAGRYEVRIAAFDTEGLYSDFSEPAYANIGR